jgi:hypothetical protein
MTYNQLIIQAKGLGAVSMRIFRIEKYEYGVGRKWIPFSYHFFNCFDNEICYFIDDLKDFTPMFVFKDNLMDNREWSDEFKNNPAYESVPLNMEFI